MKGIGQEAMIQGLNQIRCSHYDGKVLNFTWNGELWHSRTKSICKKNTRGDGVIPI